MRYDYTGARVKKLGPLGQVLYPFAGYEVAPDGTKTKFFRLGTELLASKQSPVVNPVKKVFYHNDHLGGVNVISDVNGARVQLTEYDPWGKVSRSEGNVDPEHRFTGQKLDPENGLYYYGARYYDPELARFISPDPIVPSAGDPQSHNRYSYVRNNPVKYIDPTGHSFLSFFFGGIMKAFSFVMKYAIPAFRIAGGVLELMGGGGSLLSSLQSIAGGMSSYIKNSQFQFASQVFGFFSSAGSPGGGATGGDSVMSEATSVADGSPGDLGSGEINLGTGSFTYWAKNSAGEYEIHPYPNSSYQPYDYGETTFTFRRQVGAVQTGVPTAQGDWNRIGNGLAMIIPGLGGVATGLSLSQVGRILSAPSVAHVGARLGGLTLMLEGLHTLGGVGITLGVAGTAAFGGGYAIGMGINEILGLSRGGIQGQIDDFQFLFR